MHTSEAQLKRTAHYRKVTVHDTVPLIRKKENIFYVGDNITLVSNLAGSFRMGHATSVNLQQAISFMKELHREEYRFKGIMIDVPLHKLQLAKFLQYLSSTPCANLPVLYVSTHLTQAEQKELAASHIVDDIVHPIRDIFTIGERIEFLYKVKKGTAKKQAEAGLLKKKLYQAGSAVLKRAMDILISLALLVMLLPLMMAIAIWVSLDSRGPVFHNAYRAGKGYRVFKLYRFRTGKVGAARLVTSLSQINLFRDNGAFLKACHNSGLTRAGKILRSTGLDHLPQLLNVLQGDMSIVGNRPLPLNEASVLTSDEFAERFNAPAGITGLWQVNGMRDNEHERLSFDLEYAKHHSLWLDLKILLRTPKAAWEKLVVSGKV